MLTDCMSSCSAAIFLSRLPRKYAAKTCSMQIGAIMGTQSLDKHRCIDPAIILFDWTQWCSLQTPSWLYCSSIPLTCCRDYWQRAGMPRCSWGLPRSSTIGIQWPFESAPRTPEWIPAVPSPVYVYSGVRGHLCNQQCQIVEMSLCKS